MPLIKDINLLEAYNKQFKLESEKASGILIIGLITVIGICVLVSVFIFVQLFTYSMKINSITAEINTKRIIVNKIQKDLQIKEAYDIKENFINSIIAENDKLKEILNCLEKITPTNVSFDMLQIENNKLSCRISSKNVESVVQFVYNLYNQPYFGNIIFNGANDYEGLKKADINADIVK